MHIDDTIYNVLEVKKPENLIALKGKIVSIDYFAGTIELAESIVGSTLLPEGFDRTQFNSVEVFFHCQNFESMILDDEGNKLSIMKYSSLNAFEIDDYVFLVYYPGPDDITEDEDEEEFLYIFGKFDVESPALCRKDLIFVSLDAPQITRGYHGATVYRESIGLVDCYDVEKQTRFSSPTDVYGNVLFNFPVDPEDTNYIEWLADNINPHGIDVPFVHGSELIAKTNFSFCVYGSPIEGESSTNDSPYPYYTDPNNPITYHNSPQDISVAGIRTGDPIYDSNCPSGEAYVILSEKSIGGYGVRDNGSELQWSTIWPPPDYGYTYNLQLFFTGTENTVDITSVDLSDLESEYVNYSLEVNEANSYMELLEFSSWCIGDKHSACNNYPDEIGNVADYLPYYDATTYKKFQHIKKKNDCVDSALINCSWAFYDESYIREGIFRVKRNFLVDESLNEASKRPILEERELGNSIATGGCPYYGNARMMCTTDWRNPPYEYVFLLDPVPQVCSLECYSMFNETIPWVTVELTTFSYQTIVASKDYIYDHGGTIYADRYVSMTDDLLARPLMAGGFIFVGTSGIYSFELLATFYAVSTYDPETSTYSFDFDDYDVYSRHYRATYEDLYAQGVTKFAEFTLSDFSSAAHSVSWIAPLFSELVDSYKENILAPIKDMTFDADFPMISNEDVQPTINIEIKTTTECPYSMGV